MRASNADRSSKAVKGGYFGESDEGVRRAVDDGGRQRMRRVLWGAAAAGNAFAGGRCGGNAVGMEGAEGWRAG
ncbi:conserved hypothetical protein [Burkholderia vietnamiensis]|nr:conserved hypothetical protein [Burkholderia vietnamiensis]